MPNVTKPVDPPKPPNNPAGASATSDANEAFLPKDPVSPEAQRTTADVPPDPRSPAMQGSDHPELPAPEPGPTGKPVRAPGLPPGDRGTVTVPLSPPENVAEGTSKSAARGASPSLGRQVLYCFSAAPGLVQERPAQIVRVHPRDPFDPDFKGNKLNLSITLDGRDDDGLVDATERSVHALGQVPFSHVHRTEVHPSTSGNPEEGCWRWPPMS